MTFALLVALFLALCVIAEVLKKRLTLPAEVLRKLVHIPAASFTAVLPLLISFRQIEAIGLIFAALMAVSLRAHIFSAIHGVSRTTYGEIFFPLGITALAVLCPDKTAFAYGVLVLGLGDGLAALVGGRLGKRVVPILSTQKTLWGTGTFLVVSFVLAASLLSAGEATTLGLLGTAAAIALVLTPVELFLDYGLDNLMLPVLGGLLVSGL